MASSFDFGSAFGDIGGAASSFFGAMGDFAEASSYSDAAKYAGQNAQIAQESGRIQQYSEARKASQVIGGQLGAVASGGFAEAGSSLDLLHSSVAQAALTKNLIGLQTDINVNGYLEQQSQYQGMASAANAAGGAGITKGLGSLAMLGLLFL